MKLERNESCPCGSGKKFKKCCEAGENWKGSEDGLKSDIELFDAFLQQGLQKLTEDDFAEFQDFSLESLANLLGLDDASMAWFTDTPFGGQVCLEFLLFLAPFEGADSFLHSCLENQPEVIQELSHSRLELFEIVDARENLLLVKSLLDETPHLLPVLQARELIKGEWISGRIVNTENGKLLLSSYARFLPYPARVRRLQELKKARLDGPDLQIELLRAMVDMARERGFELEDSR